MIELNSKQYKRLVQFERHLLTAVKARYISAVYKSTSDKLVEIYREVFNVNQPNTTCNRCLLDICTKLGKLYFEYKERLEANQAEKKNKEQETEQPQEQTEQPVQEDKKEEAEQAPADETKAPEKPKKQTGKKKGK